MTAVILLGHGSRLSEANEALGEVARELRSLLAGGWVEVAFLQLARPSLPDAVGDCVTAGAERIVIQPFFLFPGAHVLEDVPRAVDELRRAFPHVELVLAPHLGTHRKLAEIAHERLREAIG